MEYDRLECPGCGSADVTFDSQSRKLYCRQCGKETFYSRATLNKHGKVIYSKENAVKYFTEGKFDTARHYAQEVLNIMMDNVPAMYIMAYISEIEDKKPGRIKEFFKETRDLPIDWDEITTLKALFLASPAALIEFEADAIRLIAVNLQSEEDAKGLTEFFDSLCPYLISKRSSGNFMTQELAEMYRDLAGHCDIPKTCLMLLKGIQTNPGSPYADNSFHLRTKARNFYDSYVLAVGEIIRAIKTDSLREKFVDSYTKFCNKYEQDAGI